MKSQQQRLAREWSRMNARDRALSKSIHKHKHDGSFWSLAVMVKRALDAAGKAGR